MAGVAFFDLDRTLLRSASGPFLSKAMRDAGVVTHRLPFEALLYETFNRFGESLPTIWLSRQAVHVARGRPEGTFDEAARAATDDLLALVEPFGHALLEYHRRAGRAVVLATTTPEHLVRPLAERLGLDDVIATRYSVDGDGRYDGGITGPFVWSRGKLAAVRAWARSRGVELAESYAYSDSIYDYPLLRAVGYPNAVNPDPRLLALAAARRWPVLHFDVSPGVAKLPLLDTELQRLVLLLSRPEAYPYARFDVAGTEHIPSTGPVIVAVNHRSYFDLPAMIMVVRETGRTARFLAKQELFDLPLVGNLATALGGIRVDRGHGGGDSFDAAALALAGGELVGLMPQGTIPRGEAFFDPVLRGHLGAARLAALTRAPVVPVGLWGTEQVWPRSSPVPDVLNLAHPPTVRVRVGEPVELKYRSPRADTRRILDAISDLLPPESRRRRTPTPEELRRTHPGGVLPED
jgi:putative phosphoserine phosphatase/1-acylglycerol-3-phosphate O-acyltransferase